MIIDFLFNSLIYGFGFYSFLYFILSFTKLKSNPTLINLDKTACLVFAIGGCIFLVVWIFSIWNFYQVDEKRFINRTTGEFWYGYWLPPTLWALATQSMWIKKLQPKKWFRLFLILIILFPFEKMVIVITAMHRDFLPSSWKILTGFMLAGWFMHFCVFMVIVGIISWIRSFTKRNPAGSQK